MAGWNFADLWEAVAEAVPDAPAQVQGDRRYSWSETDRRADGIARTLLDHGVAEQDKVAQYLWNGPEYMETMFAVFKAGLVPVNTNYRYADDELLYLWDNADAVAVVFHGTFAERIEVLRNKLPNVQGWIWVDDGSGPCPDWAIPYEDAAKASAERVQGPWGRSGEHINMLYTGGTTGMPKGVMWRQADLFSSFNASALGVQHPVEPDLDAVRASVQAPGAVHLPACPLMHGTGMFTSMGAWDGGGSVITLVGRTFDAAEFLDAVQANKVNTTAIVGDAFAKPILRELDANPGRWDISSLLAVISSGVMWSEETKQGLLRHHAGMLLVDAFSSSEALGMGQSVSSGGSAAKTAKFALGENARVIDDDGNDVEPGSGVIGRVAVKGVTPVGYYKDPEKSAHTFLTIEGDRYSVPGDYATVEADGTLRLLGRGSVCINTGGEKVYPEEVEEALKTHPGIRDAVVVGVPDEKWGEAICAVVEPHDGVEIDEADVVAHVKERLSAFKAPKRVLPVASIGRAPNGKVDFKQVRALAITRLAP
jgi:fatty-acyl-CoA synthase